MHGTESMAIVLHLPLGHVNAHGVFIIVSPLFATTTTSHRPIRAERSKQRAPFPFSFSFFCLWRPSEGACGGLLASLERRARLLCPSTMTAIRRDSATLERCRDQHPPPLSAVPKLADVDAGVHQAPLAFWSRRFSTALLQFHHHHDDSGCTSAPNPHLHWNNSIPTVSQQYPSSVRT